MRKLALEINHEIKLREGKRMKFGIPGKEQLRKCDCGLKLKDAVYSETLAMSDSRFPKEKVHCIPCKCGIVWIWSFPNVWKRSHILELGRTWEVAKYG